MRCPAARCRSPPLEDAFHQWPPAEGPVSRGHLRPRCSASAASGAPSASSGSWARASTSPRSAMPAASRRTRPMRRSARAAPGTTRSCWWSFDPTKVSYETLLKTFWENHDPTQGMRQGNDVGTQYRSGIYVYGDAQRKAAEASKAMYAKALAGKGYRRDHHRDRRRAAVLFRRGLSPAVSGQESAPAIAGSAAPACRARSARGRQDGRRDRPDRQPPRRFQNRRGYRLLTIKGANRT